MKAPDVPPAAAESAPVLDEALLPLGEMIAGFLDLGAEGARPLRVEEVRLDLPVEVDVGVAEDGRARVGAAPPTQRLRTSVMPVFHRMRVTVIRGVDRG